jgi:hypothetical protein
MAPKPKTVVKKPASSSAPAPAPSKKKEEKQEEKKEKKEKPKKPVVEKEKEKEKKKVVAPVVSSEEEDGEDETRRTRTGVEKPEHRFAREYSEKLYKEELKKIDDEYKKIKSDCLEKKISYPPKRKPSRKEINKRTKEAWQNLSAEERQPYIDSYEKDRWDVLGPKQTIQPYFFFSMEINAAEKWKAMSKDEREPYEKKSEEDKKRYNSEVERWKSEHPGKSLPSSRGRKPVSKKRSEPSAEPAEKVVAAPKKARTKRTKKAAAAAESNAQDDA